MNGANEYERVGHFLNQPKTFTAKAARTKFFGTPSREADR